MSHHSHHRYTGFIDTSPPSGDFRPGICVTGLPDNGVAGHLEALRRALEPIELGLGDRVAWHAYGDFDAPTMLTTARTIYGKRLNVPRRRRSSK